VSQKQAVPVHGTSCWSPLTVRHTSPLQQLASVVHDCETFEQVGGGGPQVPELHTSVALQHGKVPLHDPPLFAQVGGGTGEAQWLVPSQVSGEQQSPEVAQEAPTALQQVPANPPEATVQVLGEQQSAFTVQLAPPVWHATGVCDLQRWVVESQSAEQQSAPDVQALPSPTQPPQTVPSKQ